MKTALLYILLFLTCINAYSQQFYAGIGMTMIKNYSKYDQDKDLVYSLKKGTTYHIDSIWQIVGSRPDNKDAQLTFFLSNKDLAIEVENDLLKRAEFHYADINSYWNTKVIENVLPQLSKHGSQYELRAEMEDETFEFIDKIRNNDLELNDPYLENYIYGLIAKIAPEDLVDGRPCNVNLLIIQDPLPLSEIYPNGTIVLTTGLIACLHTEGELVAVLANEISHFVLDHSVNNVNKEITRQKRAEFWASMATIATALIETTATVKTGYYIPGIPTMTMVMATTKISQQVIDRMGMDYNYDQCLEADKMTLDVLELLNYDKTALCSALQRIAKRFSEERNFIYLIKPRRNVSISDRIIRLGKTDVMDPNKLYEQKISFAITSLGNMLFNQGRFRQAIQLADQNISNDVASADDYLQKANCLLNLRNDHQTNVEVSSLIEKANKLDVQNLNIDRLSVLISLRENDYDTAIAQLKHYLDKLKYNDKTTEAQFNYRNAEIYWALRMLAKVQGMKATIK